MATRYNNITCLTAFEIQGTDCIGDSRYYINLNTENLGTAICNLSSSLSAQNITTTNSIRSLSTAITSVSSTFRSSTTFLSSTVFTLANNLTSLSATIDVRRTGPRATLTTLVSSLSVFNTSGTYIGYIPIYM